MHWQTSKYPLDQTQTATRNPENQSLNHACDKSYHVWNQLSPSVSPDIDGFEGGEAETLEGLNTERGMLDT